MRGGATLMRRLAIILVIGAGLYVGIALAFPNYTHRYRLTVEVDTPEGVRSGSSVIEVTRKDFRWILIGGRREFRVRGEAVFVDLGADRNVIALMAHGPRAENVDQMISLAIEAYGHYKWSEEAWAGRVKMQGPVELKPPLIPTFVTFSDVNDPKTARVLRSDNLESVFGPSVHFKRAWIEMTRSPVTSEIERRLPLLGQPGRPASEAYRAMTRNDPYGPSIGPEMLFMRGS
jgi:hypothetical protein